MLTPSGITKERINLWTVSKILVCSFCIITCHGMSRHIHLSHRWWSDLACEATKRRCLSSPIGSKQPEALSMLYAQRNATYRMHGAFFVVINVVEISVQASLFCRISVANTFLLCENVPIPPCFITDGRRTALLLSWRVHPMTGGVEDNAQESLSHPWSPEDPVSHEIAKACIFRNACTLLVGLMSHISTFIDISTSRSPNAK
mmetsp:Transcript_19207/g.36212  ORF Transcript_19207/g.36212 Transcript_19207/m.36212 type:complete len:203 (-) Transcript_19207:2878-3486(-)